MYFSFGIPVDCVNVSSICVGDLLASSRVVFEAAFVNFSAILLRTKSPVASAFFWIALFEAVLSASVADFFWCQEALPILTTQILPIFSFKE